MQLCEAGTDCTLNFKRQMHNYLVPIDQPSKAIVLFFFGNIVFIIPNIRFEEKTGILIMIIPHYSGDPST